MVNSGSKHLSQQVMRTCKFENKKQNEEGQKALSVQEKSS